MHVFWAYLDSRASIMCLSVCPSIVSFMIPLSLSFSEISRYHYLNISTCRCLTASVPTRPLLLSPPSCLKPLNVSLQEADANSGGASASSGSTGNSGEDRSFIDDGFHALATDAVEGEEGKSSSSPARQRRTSGNPDSTNGNGHDLSAVMHSIDSAAAAAAAEAASSGRATRQASRGGRGRGRGAAAAGDNVNGTREMVDSSVGGQGAGEEEDEEDFGNVELVVTQDGGIIPVAAVVGDGSAAVVAPGSKTPQTRGRGARKDGVGVEVDGDSDDVSTSGTVRSAVTQSGGVDEEGEDQCDDKEEEEDEEEAPLPPDIVLTLADDVLHRVMLFLNPEEIFECRAVSSRWEFPGHEAVFEGLCRRTYLAQVCLCVCV